MERCVCACVESAESSIIPSRCKFSYVCRLTLACGGMAMNSFDDLAPDCLGKAGLVYEHVLVSTVVHYFAVMSASPCYMYLIVIFCSFPLH